MKNGDIEKLSQLDISSLFNYFSENLPDRFVSFDEDFMAEEDDFYKDILRNLLSPLFPGKKKPRITAKNSDNSDSVHISFKLNKSTFSVTLSNDCFDPSFHDFVERVYSEQSEEVLMRDTQDDWVTYIVLPKELYERLKVSGPA